MDAFRTVLAKAVMVGVLLSSVTVMPAAAATRTWTGGPGGLWSVDSNWVEGTAPGDGDDLVFNGGSTTSTNDLTLSIATFTFGNSDHIVSGSGFTVTGGISVTAAGLHVINPQVTLGADQTWSMAVGGMFVQHVDPVSYTHLRAPRPY